MIHVLRDVYCWVGHLALRGRMNSCALKSGVDLVEVPVFGDAAKRRIPSLYDASLSIEGYADESVLGTMPTDIGVSDVPTSVAPDGQAVGDRAYIFASTTGEVSQGGTIGAAHTFSASLSAADGEKLWRGVIGHSGSESASDSADGVQLGVIDTVKKLRAALHVLASSGDNLVVSIQSDSASNFPSPTTHVTFSTFDDVGSELKEFSTPTSDTWWRVVWTLPGGSPVPDVSFVVTMGIN